MKKVLKRGILQAVLLLCVCLILCCCKKEEQPDENPLVKIEEPTATPTPTPLPTPIIDMPAGRFDAKTETRSPEDEEPEIVNFEDDMLVLNPFYAENETSQEITAKTQASLFYVDESGKALAGVDYPCVAYEYEFIDDRSVFGLEAENAPEDYKTLRVILKEGISFCDGEAVSVDDAVYSAYVLANKAYDGPFDLCEKDIYGMKAYHTQISDERIQTAEAVKNAGINADGTYPALDHIDPADQKEFWGCWDEAGILFATDIIEYVNEHYKDNVYVQTFFSNSMTRSRIDSDESLRTAFAFAMWGYMKSFNAKTMEMTDTFDNVYKLDETPLTAKDLYNAIFKYYQYDLDTQTGINYECADKEKHFEDYVEEVYLSKGSSIDKIAGIAGGAYRYEDQAIRGCIYFLVGSKVQPQDINFYVVPKHIYLGNERVNDLKGAGEYYMESFSDEENTVMLAANDDYMLGSPKKKYLHYVWSENPADE